MTWNHRLNEYLSSVVVVCCCQCDWKQFDFTSFIVGPTWDVQTIVVFGWILCCQWLFDWPWIIRQMNWQRPQQCHPQRSPYKRCDEIQASNVYWNCPFGVQVKSNCTSYSKTYAKCLSKSCECNETYLDNSRRLLFEGKKKRPMAKEMLPQGCN